MNNVWHKVDSSLSPPAYCGDIVVGLIRYTQKQGMVGSDSAYLVRFVVEESSILDVDPDTDHCFWDCLFWAYEKDLVKNLLGSLGDDVSRLKSQEVPTPEEMEEE